MHSIIHMLVILVNRRVEKNNEVLCADNRSTAWYKFVVFGRGKVMQ